MIKIFTSTLAFLLFVSSAVADRKAHTLDPTGRWTGDNKFYVFDVRYCGKKQRDLCADLVQVHPEKQKYAQQYVGTTLIKELKSRRPNSWRGAFSFRNYRVSVWIKMLDNNTARAGGCVFLFLCDQYTLRRQKS